MTYKCSGKPFSTCFLIGYVILLTGWKTRKTAKSSVCIKLVRCVVQICQWICILVFFLFQMATDEGGASPAIMERGETHRVMCEVNMLIMLIGLSDPSKCYSAGRGALWSGEFSLQCWLSIHYCFAFSHSSAAQSCCLQRSIINRTGLMPPTV